MWYNEAYQTALAALDYETETPAEAEVDDFEVPEDPEVTDVATPKRRLRSKTAK